jgi:predicted adenine nucleotide alpha hydrolase (AANH) superfamily ATPase
MSQNFCIELIPTATGNGYPKCNYSVMNMRSSNFHIYIYMNNKHVHNFNEYFCKHNVRQKKKEFGIPFFADDKMRVTEK